MEKITIPESSDIWLEAELEAPEVEVGIAKGPDALECALDMLGGTHKYIARPPVFPEVKRHEYTRYSRSQEAPFLADWNLSSGHRLLPLAPSR